MTTTGTQAVGSGSGARPYATVNPYTGETVREFPFLDSGQIPDVVERAATAFQSWRERPVADRARMVRRTGDLMLERKDALAALLTQEMGKRIGESAWEVEPSRLGMYGFTNRKLVRTFPPVNA
jgi:succinate-semialdehyde dehydrogenase / glutarate-semialdehyde dehydrogenase